MGKNFVKGGSASGGSRNATSRTVKKNISKKEADKQRKQKEYHKSVAREQKVEKKRQDWEMRKQAKRKVAEFRKPAGLDSKNKDDEWEDVDEHEKDVFDKDGYYDVMEEEAMISKNDQNILDKFQAESKKPAKASEGRSLADLIM